MGTPPTFTDGTVVHDTDLNFLVNPPRAKVYQTAAGTACADNTSTALVFDAVEYDTDSMWSAGTPTRLTAKTAGLYHCELWVRFPTAVYTTMILTPRINGASLGGYAAWNLSITGATVTAQTALSARFTMDEEFAIGDYLESYPTQRSGATRTSDIGGGASPNITGMSMRWVAKLH